MALQIVLSDILELLSYTGYSMNLTADVAT